MLTNLLLLCGVIAGPLFVTIFMVEGSRRAGFNQLRQPISALAMGERGKVQRLNFIVTGLLYALCAYGMYLFLEHHGIKPWGALFIGLYALGQIGVGIFPTDNNGLPTNNRRRHTLSCYLHKMFSLFVFIPLPLASFAYYHVFTVLGESWWADFSAIIGVIGTVGTLLFMYAFVSRGRLAPVGGLIQRATMTIAWFAVSIVAAHLIGWI